MRVEPEIRRFNQNFSQSIDVMLGDCVYKNPQGGDTYDVFFVGIENADEIISSLTFDDESGLFPRYHNLFEIMSEEGVTVNSITQPHADQFIVSLNKGEIETPKFIGEDLDVCLIYALGWLAENSRKQA